MDCCAEKCCCHRESNILDKIEFKIKESIPDYVYNKRHFMLLNNPDGTRVIKDWKLEIPVVDIEECDRIVMPKKKVISLEALNERIERLEKLLNLV